MNKKKLKLLISNFFAFGISSVLNKIIPLIALPIITNLLTDTSDYGRYDMYNTILHFGESLALLGIYDALCREYFETDDPFVRKETTSTGVCIVAISSTLVAILLIVFRKSISNLLFSETSSKSVWAIVIAGLSVFLISMKTIFSSPIRMKNQRRLFISGNLLVSIVNYALGIALVYIGFNYAGMILGSFISFAIGLLYFGICSRKDIDIKLFNKKEAKTLLMIGIPTMPALLANWAFTSIDKIMLTSIVGLNAVGIYSVGARVASVANVLNAAFSAGWTYFTFSNMKEKNQVEMTSEIFDMMMLFISLFFYITLFIYKIGFELVFSGDYQKGYMVFPCLFLSPLVLMMYLVGDSQFMIYKKSVLCSVCLLVGAGINVFLNYLLISIYGIVGASVATLAGYIVSLLMMLLICKINKWLLIKKRTVLALIFIIAVTLLTLLDSVVITDITAIFGIILIFILYRREFLKLIRRVSIF